MIACGRDPGAGNLASGNTSHIEDQALRCGTGNSSKNTITSGVCPCAVQPVITPAIPAIPESANLQNRLKRCGIN